LSKPRKSAVVGISNGHQNPKRRKVFVLAVAGLLNPYKLLFRKAHLERGNNARRNGRRRLPRTRPTCSARKGEWKVKYTPGPWESVKDVHDDLIIRTADCTDIYTRPNIAKVLGLCGDDGGRETQKANAELIASAPDLLAEVERLEQATNAMLLGWRQRTPDGWRPSGTRCARR